MVAEAAGRGRALRAQPRPEPGAVAAFVAAARAAGATLPFVAGVAVYTDERSARVLQALPRPATRHAAVERGAGRAGPGGRGIAAAVAEAGALLAVPGVAGVNLSGLGSGWARRRRPR